MIKATNLSRSYGDFKAVDNVSFEINRGEIIGLLGHNGAGKTTIMKMITGVIEPTAGDITVGGISVIEDRIAVQQKIGYLPEDSSLYDELTVLAYLDFIGKLRGISASDLKIAIKRVVGQTMLQEKANSLIKNLSKGYKQRVGVAQALLQNPEVLILDEPTNGLDPAQIQEMRNLIKELSKTTTIILSTHILQEVEAVCDRVLILARGKLALDKKLSGLQKSTTLRVAVNEEKPSTKQLLGSITGVSGVDLQIQTDNTIEYLLTLSSEVSDVAPDVANAIIKSGLRLHRLEPHAQDLEAVFRETSIA
jgi:ABC-2 type transport system ATP-binding protein